MAFTPWTLQILSQLCSPILTKIKLLQYSTLLKATMEVMTQHHSRILRCQWYSRVFKLYYKTLIIPRVFRMFNFRLFFLENLMPFLKILYCHMNTELRWLRFPLNTFLEKKEQLEVICNNSLLLTGMEAGLSTTTMSSSMWRIRISSAHTGTSCLGHIRKR